MSPQPYRVSTLRISVHRASLWAEFHVMSVLFCEVEWKRGWLQFSLFSHLKREFFRKDIIEGKGRQEPEVKESSFACIVSPWCPQSLCRPNPCLKA